MGKLKVYIAVLAVLLLAIILLDGSAPKPIDWRPTYSVRDKIPFGLYVLDREIDSVVKTPVERIGETPYEFLDSKYDKTDQRYDLKGNILSISGDTNLDSESLKEVFYFVSHGNTAFLSMTQFPEMFLDSLNVKIDRKLGAAQNLKFSMANPAFGKKEYEINEGAHPYYFSSVDTANTTVLGYVKSDSLRANYIKVHFANGYFYLHTTPAAFTNFHLLNANNFEYAQNVLSYLPKTDTYWFVGGRNASGNSISDSPLRYIFSQPALKWAWLLFLFGMLAFMIFNARRKQRIVPIVEPLSNTTVDFAKTIGNLYYQEGDHHAVIDRKIIYFLEKIRIDYHLDTTKLDDAFARKLQQKSGKDMADIENTLFLIRAHRNSPHTAIEEDLIKINTALEKILH